MVMHHETVWLRMQVGFITDGITQKMTDLSSGMTRVTESGHTLLLGWNGSTLRLVKQVGMW
jgi:hypothetical protein